MSKYASLTSGILARKGEAEPTATPFADQLLTRVGCPAPEIEGLTPMHSRMHLHAESRTRVQSLLTPPAPRPLDVLLAAAPCDDEESAGDHCVACPGPSPDEAGKTYHVNLRMKRTRFIKLKLSSALLRRPVQEIVAEALDQWFETLPRDVLGDCACLKARGD